MVTMMQDAVIKIINGVTTIEEVERILGSSNDRYLFLIISRQ